jgi:putative SOS response-associated peptidase YedK
VCNLYQLEKSADAIRKLFADNQITLEFPEGVPNFQPRDVRISERAPIVRYDRDHDLAQLVERRWSWPGPGGKPVFNMRSDGREFANGRCLVMADGFYEFTNPTDPKRKRKDCWLFRPADGGAFAIAGLFREHPDVGEAFTLLTVPPGPDIAAYHNRQVALLPPTRWRSWLDGTVPSADLLSPSASGRLAVAAV